VLVYNENQYNKKRTTYKSSQTLETTRYNVGREERRGEFPQNSLISIEGFLLHVSQHLQSKPRAESTPTTSS